MRLGVLADIHEQLPRLRAALTCFRRERVDQVVVLGDVFEMGSSLEATVDLLIEVGAVGYCAVYDTETSELLPFRQEQGG